MSAAIVRFRCYRCDQLLGVSASKVGKTATCIRCHAELQVPAPEDEPIEVQAPEPRSEAPEPAQVASKPDPIPAEPAPTLVQSPDPSERLAGDPVGEFDLGSIEIAPTRLFDPAIRRESPPFRVANEAVEPFSADLLIPPPEKAPFIPEDTVAAEIRIEPPRVVDRSVASRRNRDREVVLSSSVVAAWMFFLLLGLALSFVGGLLVGHYLWRTPTDPAAAARS
jgi:hypothetical protein